MFSLLILQNKRFLCLFIFIFCQLGHREQVIDSENIGFLHGSAMAMESREVKKRQSGSHPIAFGRQKIKPLSNWLPPFKAFPSNAVNVNDSLHKML